MQTQRFPLVLSLSLAVLLLCCEGGLRAQDSGTRNLPDLGNSLAASTSPSNPVSDSFKQGAATDAPPRWTSPNEHPLDPVLRWAKEDLPDVEKIKDYSATLIRRERVQGALTNYEYMFVKIRHQPFSVYVSFEAPNSVKGQEVVYVAGENHGNMLAHNARMRVPMAIQPAGPLGMSGRRYPLTEIGVVNLVRRLVEVGEQDKNFGECEVQYFKNAKVDKRLCTVIQVTHPVERDAFNFHLARIFVDRELNIPTRYESYTWPREPGGEPRLIEEYTYTNIKLNNGFTDQDFSTKNPAYNFKTDNRKS